VSRWIELADSPAASSPNRSLSAGPKSPVESPCRSRIGQHLGHLRRAPGVGGQDPGAEPPALAALLIDAVAVSRSATVMPTWSKRRICNMRYVLRDRLVSWAAPVEAPHLVSGAGRRFSTCNDSFSSQIIAWGERSARRRPAGGAAEHRGGGRVPWGPLGDVSRWRALSGTPTKTRARAKARRPRTQ
jgi:hypothetical protein